MCEPTPGMYRCNYCYSNSHLEKSGEFRFAEALLLTQTTAIFRTFADENCEELSRFVKAHNQNYNFPPSQCEKLRKLAKEAKS